MIDRAKSRLFVCIDHSLGELCPNGTVALVVYSPSARGCVGFNCDEMGRAIRAGLLDGAWYLAEDGFYQIKSGKESVAFRDSVIRDFIFVHGCKDTAILEFEGVRNYYRALKKHELNLKYERPTTSPSIPVILRLLCRDKDNLTDICCHLHGKCDFFTLWPMYDQGFGEHFYIFPCSQESGVHHATTLAQKFGCAVRVCSFTEIPMH